MKKTTLSERLKLARTSAKERQVIEGGLRATQTMLAEACQVTRTAIAKIESGEVQSPKNSTIGRAAAYLRVRIEWLQYGDGVMDPQQPEVDALPTSQATNGRLASQVTNASVIVIEQNTDAHTGWKCLIPELSLEDYFSVTVAPSINRENLAGLEMFQADVVILKEQSTDTARRAFVIKVHL